MASSLAQYESLLADSRVDALRDKLGRELQLPDEVEFATYVQDEQWAEKDGLQRLVPAHAVFLVLSPNPHPRLAKHTLKSHAATRLSYWRQKEDQMWRFVGRQDPAELIFRALAVQHMDARKNYTEMI
jgi:hypothetical protein